MKQKTPLVLVSNQRTKLRTKDTSNLEDYLTCSFKQYCENRGYPEVVFTIRFDLKGVVNSLRTVENSYRDTAQLSSSYNLLLHTNDIVGKFDFNSISR